MYTLYNFMGRNDFRCQNLYNYRLYCYNKTLLLLSYPVEYTEGWSTHMTSMAQTIVLAGA